MLRYDRQTKPGLVALYDIRPGNGAGQFLQARSPHGAYLHKSKLHLLNCKVVKQQYQCSIFTTLQLNITKKRSEETQTLHAGCSKVEPKFRPAADPFPGAWNGQNLISWRWSLPLPTNQVWWGSMHAISSYRSNRPTNTHTHKQTDRTDYNTLHHSFAIVQCN